jgi:peptide deformylase
MAIREIKKYPDEILKKKALPVNKIDGDVRSLIKDMVDTMYAAPGIGLAAPQVGVSKRIIVVDVTTKEEKHPLIILINPEIVDADGIVDSDEGCLSVPGYNSSVKRAEKVVAKGLDQDGNCIEVSGTGLFARALQHEIDHLDGILFVDRLSSLKKEFFKKRYLKKVEALK